MKVKHSIGLLWQTGAAYFRAFVYIFFVFFYLPASLFGQDITSLHIEKVQEDGLFNNYINCINQDKNGFIWFGTREGLFKYDGYAYKSFRNSPGDSTTLTNNVILSLCPEQSNLWVGSSGSLSCVDIDLQTVRNYPTPLPALVNFIQPKNDSVLWVGTSCGLFEFDKKHLKWKRADFLKNNFSITSLSDDKKGHLYIIPSNHGLYCYTESIGSLKYYHPYLLNYPESPSIYQPNLGKSWLAPDGMLWLCSWAGGLVQFNTTNRQIKQWLHPTDDVNYLPYKITADILPDKNGNIWLANKEGGLTIYDPSKNKFFNYPVEWKSENTISGSVISLFRDRSGIVWIGTENGIFKYDPHHVHLSKTEILLKTKEGTVAAHISPTSMLKDKDGLWWIGMFEGIFTLDPKTNVLQDRSKPFGLSANSPIFNMVQGDDGAVWFTTRNLLVRAYKKSDKNGNSFRAEMFKSENIKSAMSCLYVDGEQKMWIGTNSDGVFRFDNRTKRFIPYPYNKVGIFKDKLQVNSICRLSKDSLLIGGEYSGLWVLNTINGMYTKVQWPNMSTGLIINSIYKKRNTIWIGTQEDGLWETDLNLKKPLIITTNNGLPSMCITTIAGSSNRDDFWMLTNSGAVEYHITDKKITVFDKKDGIQNLSHLYTMIANNDGSIVIGGRGCLYSFDPSQVIKNTQAPKVFITGLKVFDKEFIANKARPIELNYNQNYFSLEYVALNYTQSKLNRYAYKMDGLDKQWIDAGTRRYVSYANLEEGTYTFNIKASNNEGVWNNLPARITLIINPPFWHRWWFYMSVVLVMASVIYLLYIYSINQLKIRVQMRDKIARDLHDDIGSTLSGINIFSKIALQKMHDDQSGGLELVAKISERSQNTLEALSDIVWSINTRNDGMDNFLMKANEYLSILEVQGIGYDFNVDPEMGQMKLGMIWRRELYLIFKEAICNAAKYARCTFIQIHFTRHKDHCTLTIHDNGIGFNVDDVATGNGIYNMRQRAQKINGELKVISKENEGTLITLNFKITRFR